MSTIGLRVNCRESAGQRRAISIQHAPELSSPRRAPREYFVLHPNKSGRREELRVGRRFLAGRNKPCHPYLAVSKIWIAFTVAAFQGGTGSSDLINAPHHAGVVQSRNEAITLFVYIRCYLM